jgi:hypothetical protein
VDLPEVSIILWQEPNEPKERVKALIYTENEERLKKLAEELHVHTLGTYILTNAYTNFSEAELEIRKIIKRII